MVVRSVFYKPCLCFTVVSGAVAVLQERCDCSYQGVYLFIFLSYLSVGDRLVSKMYLCARGLKLICLT